MAPSPESAPLLYETCGDGRLIPEEAERRGGYDGVVEDVGEAPVGLQLLVEVVPAAVVDVEEAPVALKLGEKQHASLEDAQGRSKEIGTGDRAGDRLCSPE